MCSHAHHRKTLLCYKGIKAFIYSLCPETQLNQPTPRPSHPTAASLKLRLIRLEASAVCRSCHCATLQPIAMGLAHEAHYEDMACDQEDHASNNAMTNLLPGHPTTPSANASAILLASVACTPDAALWRPCIKADIQNNRILPAACGRACMPLPLIAFLAVNKRCFCLGSNVC